MIYVVARHNPAEVRRIKATCSYTEIALAYRSLMTHTYGVGHTTKPTNRKR